MMRVLLAVTLAASFFAQSSRAQITIVPTFDSFISSNPTIQSTITTALNQYTTTFTTSSPVTIRLSFQNTTSGLGASSTNVIQTTYSAWRAALAARAVSADDISSLAFIPNQANSPVNGNANVQMSRANARILGLVGASATNDTTISLNFALMNWDRNGPSGTGNNYASSHYDLKAVAQHEIDEALGTISGVGGSVPWGADHTRFGAAGSFSFTTSTTAPAYFSVNGGVTNLVNYNQRNGNTGDYGDFMITGHVQDWAGTPGSTPDLNVELRLLDVVGYTFASVPEPTTIALMGVISVCSLGAIWHVRRSKYKLAEKQI